MIDHTGIGVADVARSARFYDAALGTLGLRRLKQMPGARPFTSATISAGLNPPGGHRGNGKTFMPVGFD